ncbi:MAG: DsbA family protein [Acidiferrobacterales bacterium]
MTYARLISRSVAIVMVSIVVLTSGCVSGSPGEAEQKEIAALKKENALLRRQLNLTRQQLQLSANRRQNAYRPRLPEVQFGDGPRLGNSKATIALIEFSDYFCPYCARFHNTTFDLIKQNYIDKGKLLYVYRDFPRSAAKRAIDAAIAANCAGEQGAYWEMQKKLFRHSPRINLAFYKSAAKELGLDARKYEACLRSDQQPGKIESDYVYGRSLGIRGTPTFYIGRVTGNKITAATTIVGAQPYQKFSESMDRFLRLTQ